MLDISTWYPKNISYRSENKLAKAFQGNRNFCLNLSSCNCRNRSTIYSPAAHPKMKDIKCCVTMKPLLSLQWEINPSICLLFCIVVVSSNITMNVPSEAISLYHYTVSFQNEAQAHQRQNLMPFVLTQYILQQYHCPWIGFPKLILKIKENDKLSKNFKK